MNDVNHMDDSMESVEQPLGLGRRDFLTKAAAAGAVIWVTPMILSRAAHAVDGGGGTPNCRPTFTFDCVLHDCEGGEKEFPGFTVNTEPCPCSDTMPPQQPVTCIKITPKPPSMTFTCDGFSVVAYGAGTDCRPLQQHPTQPDVILNTGDWECFDASGPVFFGKARSAGGAISNLPSCDLEFRVAVWAGRCPDDDSTDDAFTCQTFIVKICYRSSGQGSISCSRPTDPFPCPGGGFTPAPAAQSLCDTPPPATPPCCPPLKTTGDLSCC